MRSLVALVSLAIAAPTVSLATLAPAGAGTLEWGVQPTPNAAGSQSVLYAVNCPTSSNCIAVGETVTAQGVVPLAELWNGSTWSLEPTPAPTRGSWLGAVSCTSAAYCLAVGLQQTPEAQDALAELWDGSTWSVVPTPTSPQAELYGVSCVLYRVIRLPFPRTQCTVSGTEVSSAGSWQPLAWIYNGGNWTTTNVPLPAGSPSGGLTTVSCTSTGACTAAGEFENGSTEVPLVERWNGSTWTVEPTASPATAGIFWGVSCATSTRCTAVGNAGGTALIENWNGTSWTVEPTPLGTASAPLSSVSCYTSDVTGCTAVGGDNEQTLALFSNGSTAAVQGTPGAPGNEYSSLMGVACTSSTSCESVGYGSGPGNTSSTLAEYLLPIT